MIESAKISHPVGPESAQAVTTSRCRLIVAAPKVATRDQKQRKLNSTLTCGVKDSLQPQKERLCVAQM